MLKGKRLKLGDTIGIIGPSGTVRKEGAVDQAVEYAKSLGFNVKLGESAHAKYGYLSGTDELRARDVNTMFADPQVDAIVCTRGGYGTMRMLDLLDYDVIRANPKVFVGFSDITAMHIAFLKKSGLVTFHGPMAVSWMDDFPDGFTQKALYDAVMRAEPLGELVNAPGYHARETVNSGCAEGLLVGGNLSLIAGTIGTTLGMPTLEMGIFGGILVGLLVAVLHNRFYKVELPAVFSFFGGVRFVPIICTLASLVLGVVCFFAWPPVQKMILASGQLVVKSGLYGTFIFGFMERALIPFGLHHVFYMPFWQSALGGAMNIDGTMYYGAQNIFFAQLASPNTQHFAIEAARFMTGKYAIMMGGLLGAALAMYTTAKPTKQKVVGGLLLSAALTSFLTGITEPIEFTFLFVAPLLYIVHCAFAGLSFVLMHVFKITIGTTFSCGLIDYVLYGVLQGNAKTNWILLLPIFIIYFVVYYYLFRWVILKWNLPTPGREDDTQETKLYSKADYQAKQAKTQTKENDAPKENFQVDEQLEAIIAGLGGVDNMGSVECCATRLRLNVQDPAKIDKALLKQAGGLGTIINGNAVQVVFGPVVSTIKPRLQRYIDLKRQS
ncbi:MAG: PTS transporter subunit EIIC [Akkermansia sp.]|nr:PTS transporter subunit EIIC [Akkermansia sp.]